LLVTLVTTALHREVICFPQLPLAVYREMAAHLQQLAGVETALLPPQGTQFDYYQGQVGSLQLGYPLPFPDGDRQRLEEIIEFYAGRYGTPERREVRVSSYSV
jgi:hypothetical protein